jgi:hypothetical protein
MAEIARIGALPGALAVNAVAEVRGLPVTLPGLHQGIVVDRTGVPVDLTDWVWKLRYPPWCGMAAPRTQRLSVWITPLSNDPTGMAVQLQIAWGDGTVTTGCQSGTTVRHDYTAMGRYTLAVRATNALGDGMTLTRDLVMVEYPASERSWRYGQSPGVASAEQEP